MWILRDRGIGRWASTGRFFGMEIGVIEYARLEALLGIRDEWHVEDQKNRVRRMA
jgi:hypothetical protein